MSAAAFVVPDAHGNAALVRGLLEQEGLIEQDWLVSGELAVAARVMPRSEVEIVQIGDLANCVADSTRADIDALDLVHAGLIDVMLVGNHEHPYFGGPGFAGFWPDEEVRRSVLRLRDRGDLVAAHAVGDILITHAGLTSYWLREFGAWEMSAAEIAEYSNRTWASHPRALIFSAIGYARGGREREGGILWADWRETKPRHLRQLVGHTVGGSIRRRAGATCIDLGAGKHSTRIAGAWIRDGVIDVVIHGATVHEPQTGVAA